MPSPHPASRFMHSVKVAFRVDFQLTAASKLSLPTLIGGALEFALRLDAATSCLKYERNDRDKYQG